MKKRFTSKIFFSAITKNSNWDILAKNLVTFKRQDGVKDENLFGVGWRGVHKKQGELGQFVNLREGLGKKEGWVGCF